MMAKRDQRLPIVAVAPALPGVAACAIDLRNDETPNDEARSPAVHPVNPRKGE